MIQNLLMMMLLLNCITECMFSGWFSGKKPEAIYSLSDSNGFALGIDKVTTVKSADGQRETHALYDMASNHLGDFIVIKSKGMSGYEIKSDKGGSLFNQLVQLVAKKNNIKIESSFAPFRRGTAVERTSTVSEIKELSEEEAKKLMQSGVTTVSSSRIEGETSSESRPSKPNQTKSPIPTKETYEGGLTIEEIQDDFNRLITVLGLELELISSLNKRS